MIRNILKNTQQLLTDKKSLRILGLSRKSMLRLLEELEWKKAFLSVAEKADFSAANVLSAMKPFMDGWAQEPEGGWLRFICEEIKSSLYPENFHVVANDAQAKAKYFFLQNYRALLGYEKEIRGFLPTDNIELLERQEVRDCITFKEYEKLRAFWSDSYIFEFMRISREITPFNTIGHIGGVHYVATFVGNQLKNTDIPIDMALLSGAAAGHDLGKFGCSPSEARRIPYLHYYYTDRLLKRQNMPMIAHIASNHSTWDLELENLSVESLLLIYADFRVKSSRGDDGKEIVHFYTLTEAFDVILGKLDNVDTAKKHRYERVYAKLKDFENYLIDLGVETDVWKEPSNDVGMNNVDTALLMGNDVVEHIKYTAIEHNIRIMSIFNNESAFGSLIEAARSEKQWKSQRTYLNILSEYFTYMTKQEKQLTVNFLYELLSHREGDIRRQAGRLMGVIIAKYDDIYRKELPECAHEDGTDKAEKSEAVELWATYLEKIVFPDYKVTDQHRSWIGYTLKVVLQGLLETADDDSRGLFMKKYFDLFRMGEIRDSAVFVLLDSLITVPGEILTEDEMMSVLRFAERVSARDSIEIKLGALRAAEYISGKIEGDEKRHSITMIIQNAANTADNISVAYLVYKILKNVGEREVSDIYYSKIKNLEERGTLGDAISGIFRENLKVGTPWVMKIVNMEFLLEYALSEKLSNQTFFLATHFSNLIKVKSY